MAMVLAALVVFGEEVFDGLLVEVSSFEGSAGEDGIDKSFSELVAEPSAQGYAKAPLGSASKRWGDKGSKGFS